MGLLSLIGKLLHPGQARFNSLAQTVNGLPSDAEPNMAGEPTRVEGVPVPGDPGPSVPVPSAQVLQPGRIQPGHNHKGGILGALQNVFMPNADSLWAGALRDGLVNAHQSQDTYRTTVATQGQAAADAAYTRQRTHQKDAETDQYGEQKVLPTGDVVTINHGQVTPAYSPPPRPDAKEKLIDRWKNSQDPRERNLIELILGGANNPEVINMRADAAARVAEARAAAVARHRAPPRAGSGKTPIGSKLPSGFILD